MTSAVVVTASLSAVSGSAGVLVARRWSLRADRMAGVGRRNRTHGHTSGGKVSGTYITWLAMLNRTTRESSPGWRWYGGRGISVDPRWRSFSAFLADVGERPPGRTLDRIDPDGGYCRTNCRWATWPEQVAHRRPRGSGSTPAPAPSWSKA